MEKFIIIVFLSIFNLSFFAGQAFASTTRFLYDGDGARVAKIEEGKTTLYVGDLEKNITTGETTRYYSISGKRVAVKDSSGTNHIVSNHLGSLTTLIDLSGSPKSNIYYYPYGAVRVKTGLVIASRQYTSQINDQETGLYFYNARYYNPQNATFVQADRTNNPNKYNYVRGNPISRNDPTGNEDDDVTKYIEEVENQYGVKFINQGANWSKQEVQAISGLLLKIPKYYYTGFTFYRETRRDQTYSAYTFFQRDVHFLGFSDKVKNKISSSSFGKLGPLEYTLEYYMAHEIYHNVEPQMDFQKTMKNSDISWIYLGTEEGDREFEEAYSNYRKPQYKLLYNVYGQNVGIKNSQKLITEYAAETPFEALADYGAYFLVNYGQETNTNFVYPLAFLEEVDRELRALNRRVKPFVSY